LIKQGIGEAEGKKAKIRAKELKSKP